MIKEIDLGVMRQTLPGINKWLLTYLELMECAQSPDFTKGTEFEEFQRKYKGFYRVRRNDDWCQSYFSYMERNKGNRFTFEDVLTHMFEATGRIEASFSSKLLATIHPDKPIWDSYVMSQLNLAQPAKGQKNKQKQLKQTISKYYQLTEWYERYIETPNAKNVVKAFDETFPNATQITDIKKIDCALWSMGANRRSQLRRERQKRTPNITF